MLDILKMLQLPGEIAALAGLAWYFYSKWNALMDKTLDAMQTSVSRMLVRLEEGDIALRQLAVGLEAAGKERVECELRSDRTFATKVEVDEAGREIVRQIEESAVETRRHVTNTLTASLDEHVHCYHRSRSGTA